MSALWAYTPFAGDHALTGAAIHSQPFGPASDRLTFEKQSTTLCVRPFKIESNLDGCRHAALMRSLRDIQTVL